MRYKQAHSPPLVLFPVFLYVSAVKSARADTARETVSSIKNVSLYTKYGRIKGLLFPGHRSLIKVLKLINNSLRKYKGN